MKNLKSSLSKIVFTTLLFVCALASQPAQAQITFDDDVDDEVPAAPIDGLLGLGIAAGAGIWYGVKKLREKN